MAIIFWWMLIVWPLLIGGAFVARHYLKKHSKKSKAIPVAHSDRLVNLKQYQENLKKYKLILKFLTFLIITCLIISIFLSSRPASISISNNSEKNRDIMLCLDVSGSMSAVDVPIINKFIELAKNFSGQRFGLTIFNSAAINEIPLTDDYQLIGEQLNAAKAGLEAVQNGTNYDYVDGTFHGLETRGSSLIGDGLASCIEHLGTNPTHRSQSIILATDNQTEGTPFVSFSQAMADAKQHNIRVYSIDPGIAPEDYVSEHTQMKDLSEQTGGGYYLLQNVSVGTIIDNISKQESKYFAGSPQLVKTDKPNIFIYVLVVLVLILLILTWRFQL